MDFLESVKEIDFFQNLLPKILMTFLSADASPHKRAPNVNSVRHVWRESNLTKLTPGLSTSDIQLGQAWYKYFSNINDRSAIDEYIKLLIFFAQQGKLDGPFLKPPNENGRLEKIDAMHIAYCTLEKRMKGDQLSHSEGDIPIHRYKQPDLEKIAAITDPIYLKAFMMLKKDPKIAKEMFNVNSDQLVIVYGDSSIRSGRRKSSKPHINGANGIHRNQKKQTIAKEVPSKNNVEVSDEESSTSSRNDLGRLSLTIPKIEETNNSNELMYACTTNWNDFAIKALKEINADDAKTNSMKEV